MSVTVARTDGVTVFTLTSDPKSACPPLCQILKGLCYSPVCCSVSQHLRKAQRSAQSLLGALHIMTGLLNIGFGAILLCTRASSYDMNSTLFPVWLGILYVAFGITCILSEKFPSPCLVVSNVILNLSGVAFAIAAIVLYSINVDSIRMWWMCSSDYYWYSYGTTNPTDSPEKKMLLEKCNEGKALVLILARSINAVLIILSVLELCLAISSAVLGIKALKCSEKEQDMIAENPEDYKPLLEEVTTNSTP
ncbi:uncharacterized protein LOC117513965 [Thalassophryne amazonica]|uniref:uncharacterized protein LOC117513965 n=1 Tax=Thalassophryne amazonica TaxID=390379 RepID=UPI0014713650|nr:uncharacterized protein LOC117513965 [Thalassophryne amazonica]XP_034030118.1 uncharacterized protein LOC117513965 [Thalassophryne amazonica]XP_034030119.1 uncharacterized protein LOC117513965 [Thalassophryne amazonica]